VTRTSGISYARFRDVVAAIAVEIGCSTVELENFAIGFFRDRRVAIRIAHHHLLGNVRELGSAKNCDHDVRAAVSKESTTRLMTLNDEDFKEDAAMTCEEKLQHEAAPTLTSWSPEPTPTRLRVHVNRRGSINIEPAPSPSTETERSATMKASIASAAEEMQALERAVEAVVEDASRDP
tara:strand:+ start:567 stop:1103 length:537 start_codon:yes stop_codon:yes gene_type:complete